MTVRLIMLLPIFAQSTHGQQADRKVIQKDEKSTATILSISAKPLTVKVRFTNNSPHSVELLGKVGMLQRKDGNQWESLFVAIKDNYGVPEDMPEPSPPMLVKTKETVEVELTSVDSYKPWSKGDVLRIVFLHRLIEKDFPELDRIERMRAVVTAPFESEEPGAPNQ